MNLISRFFKFALPLLVLFALTSLPGTWSPHSATSWLSAPPAWAGSPDETLNPKSNPAGRLIPETSAQGKASVSGPRTQVNTLPTRFERFVLVWKSLAFALRF